MIAAGRLDRRCLFQEPVETADGGGGVSVVWTDRFSRWGALALPSLKVQQEAIAAGAVTSATAGTLTVREDSATRDIGPSWRVEFGGLVWNIREVHPPVAGDIRMAVESGVPA